MPKAAKPEHKSLPMLEAKMSDEGNGRLTGYVSVKNSEDSYGDIILDGAYGDLASFIKSGYSGFNHSSEPVGMIMDAREDTKGLFVDIEFHSHPEAQKIRQIAKERLDAGKDVGMSIMYRTLESSWVERDGEQYRELRLIEVVEGGFVMLPAHKGAQVASVKSEHGVPFDQKFEALLVDAEDITSRWETFDADRKQGLSEKHCERIDQLVDRLTTLRVKNAPEPVADEVLASLKPDF